MAKTLRTPAELIAARLSSDGEREILRSIAARYAIAISPAMRRLIEAAPDGPVARQFIPRADELVTLPEERIDPIGDVTHSPVPGIVHRYDDRVLLKITHTCPVYCRFCFRREMVGPSGEGTLGESELANAIAYIARTPQIREVILTGGDPLVLSARRIEDVTLKLGAIAHVQALRWHTRVPVVRPDLITGALVSALKCSEKAVFLAVHANHADEFTAEARAAIARLDAAGIQLLSQSVLLRGINDNVDALESLMRTFVSNGIKPYYLHHADLAPGTAHFRTTFEDGLNVMDALRARLPASFIPRYVIDIPDGFGKVPVERVRPDGEAWQVPDRFGQLHRYPPDVANS